MAACSATPSVPTVHLDATNPRQQVVAIEGISRRDRDAYTRAHLTTDQWNAILRIAVKGSSVPVAGRYEVGETVRFVPLFPLDPGREYDVVFDPSALARSDLPRLARVTATVALPARERSEPTAVAAVYPSGRVIPENQLRMYVQFSAPMGQQGGLEHVAVLDRNGRELKDAILPLDTELWNGDRTRFTIIFDPGRVKREILPNRRMGRPFHAGETITLVVKKDWLDAHGVPLKAEFRRVYQVGAADVRALDPAAWRIDSPAPGTRDPFVVTFPEPLDHALLQRALGIARGGTPVDGDPHTDTAETRWLFVPRAPWQPGTYALAVLPVLEDLAGNRLDRPFEVASLGDAAPAESAQPIALPFQIGKNP